MQCELTNKDVLIDVWKEIKDAKDNILKTVYKCSECYVEITRWQKKCFNIAIKMGDKNVY